MLDHFYTLKLRHKIVGEGYDEGQPPETLVNVTVAPMVMEVLQVLHLN